MFNGGTTFANKTLRHAALLLWLIAAALGTACADPVKITFVPPPMEGTLSLGVYDGTGRLVRVLHREAEVSELTAGDDGLITQWDGNDDQGKPCPTGSYRVRGVLVGDLGVEGVEFVGNDWVTGDDAPHLRKITQLGMRPDGTLVLSAMLPPGGAEPRHYAVSVKPATTPGEEGEVQLTPVAEFPPATEKGAWAIAGQNIKSNGRVLRAQPDDPPPVQLAASPDGTKLYVLYENATLQRLRGYDFIGVKPGGKPKVLFENDIRACDSYEEIAGELKFPNGQPFTPSPTGSILLAPNIPGMESKPGTLEIRVQCNRAGSHLQTADGLLLCHISDTPFLRWARIGKQPGSPAITLFDSDGAVVEQFQIAKPGNMMPFEAGTVQWTAPAPATPTPSPTPAATP